MGEVEEDAESAEDENMDFFKTCYPPPPKSPLRRDQNQGPLGLTGFRSLSYPVIRIFV